MALPWFHTLLPGPKWGVGRGEEGEGDEAGIVRALVGLERAPLATIREAQRWLPTGFAPTFAFGLEARPLTSTRTHGQVCPLVQSTKESMFFEPEKSVIQQKDGLWSQRPGFESLQLTSCVTLDKCFFSLSVRFSSAKGKRIRPEVIGKINPITPMKAPRNVPGTWWVFKHSTEKRCLGRKNLPVFLQTYLSEHFYSGMAWAVWPVVSPLTSLILNFSSKGILIPWGRDS